MIPKRAGLVIWVNDLRAARNLERTGNIHFISRRLKYVVMYINERDLRKTISYLERLPFVQKVERSYRSEIIHMDFSQKA
ncbi:YlbG family protein [Tepidibacillus marianensis]|uniref:YlbG family protein n=1 Tax=Tepidibacillus marianensis TaxID=3131995 RepID=UPI0030D0DA97